MNTEIQKDVIRDSLKLNWEKKISLREIAQFYEDKIRELDSRYQYLEEKIEALSKKNLELINEFENYSKAKREINRELEEGRNSYVAKFEEASKKQEEAIRKVSEYIVREGERVKREQTEMITDAIKGGNAQGYIRARLEMDVLTGYFFPFLLRNYPDEYEMIKATFLNARKSPEVYLPVVNSYVKSNGFNADEIALPIIIGMLDDYLKMFEHLETGILKRRGKK